MLVWLAGASPHECPSANLLQCASLDGVVPDVNGSGACLVAPRGLYRCVPSLLKCKVPCPW